MFTINNWSEQDLALLQEVTKSDDVVGVAYQAEVGASGTPHLQGTISYKVPKRISQMKKWHPTAHFDQRKGTRSQAVQYCTKDDTRLEGFTPVNTFKDDESGKRTDLEECKALLDAGKSLLHLAEEHFGQWCRYRNSFREYKEMRRPGRNFQTWVIYISGPTGTGKNQWIDYFLAGHGYTQSDVCVQTSSQCTTDYITQAYADQEVFVMEEYQGKLSFGLLLAMCGDQPCYPPVKGGQRNFCPKWLIINSNHKLQELYPPAMVDPSKFMALRSRVLEVQKLGLRQPFHKVPNPEEHQGRCLTELPPAPGYWCLPGNMLPPARGMQPPPICSPYKSPTVSPVASDSDQERDSDDVSPSQLNTSFVFDVCSSDDEMSEELPWVIPPEGKNSAKRRLLFSPSPTFTGPRPVLATPSAQRTQFVSASAVPPTPPVLHPLGVSPNEGYLPRPVVVRGKLKRTPRLSNEEWEEHRRHFQCQEDLSLFTPSPSSG